MTLFSAYRDAFGAPGEGVHRHRLLGAAGVDYLLSLVLAAVLAGVTRVPLVLTTVGVLLAGMLAHYLFGVPTHALRYLGLTT